MRTTAVSLAALLLLVLVLAASSIAAVPEQVSFAPPLAQRN
jgi:hypothetical protein